MYWSQIQSSKSGPAIAYCVTRPPPELYVKYRGKVKFTTINSAVSVCYQCSATIVEHARTPCFNRANLAPTLNSASTKDRTRRIGWF